MKSDFVLLRQLLIISLVSPADGADGDGADVLMSLLYPGEDVYVVGHVGDGLPDPGLVSVVLASPEDASGLYRMSVENSFSFISDFHRYNWIIHNMLLH